MKLKGAVVFLVLGLGALNAHANGGYGPGGAFWGEWADPALQLAQASRGEGWGMRERWRDLPPDERAALRRQFQQHWESLPPEQREYRRRELMQQWNNLPPPGQERRYPQDQPDDSGYGRGWEHRGYRR